MKTLFYLILFCFQLPLFGQLTSISTGSGYSKQSFYHLASGTETQINNDAWDIAFSNTSSQDVGILVNESVSSTGNPLRLYLAPTSVWEEPIIDLSVFVDSVQLFNPDINWTIGAFNTVKDSGNPLDFGWGSYNPQTHEIVGSRIFVLQKRDLSYCKLQIQRLSGATYTIRYASLDGSNEIINTIDRNNAEVGPLLLFSMASGDVIETPEHYDFIFMRYVAALDAGGVIVEYPVTGILLAPETKGVKATSVDPLDVNESDYKNDYTNNLQVIGHDWKFFDFNLGWVLDDSTAYFIQTKNKDKYKLVFLEFKGSSTGTAVFLQEFLGNTSAVNQEKKEPEFQIFPNPVSDFIKVESAEQGTIQFELFSLDGRLLLKSNTIAGSQIDVSGIDYHGPAFLKLISDGKTKTFSCIMK